MADIGPCGPCSRDPLRPRRRVRPRARSASPTTPSTARAGSRSGTSCSWSSTCARSVADAAAVPERRHRDGPRADGERPPAGPEQLRHRPVRADPRPDARAPRPRSRRVRGGALQLPGHRRPLAGGRRSSSPTASCPSNEGRGYVLRRILRRAVRHGRLLGRREPFLAETAQVVIDMMGGAYPHLVDGRDPILGTIVREEAPVRPDARRRDRAARGGAHPADRRPERVVGRRPEDLPADAPVLAGDVAFRLHDTYGFPIDLTVELAAEYGVAVDRPGFEVALAEQRERSRSGHEGRARRDTPSSPRSTSDPGPQPATTKFLGYETTMRRRPRSWRSSATASSTRRSRPAARPSCGPAAARGRDRPRPDPVLRRGRRPGRRSRACSAAAGGSRRSSRSRTPSGPGRPGSSSTAGRSAAGCASARR